jgi:hypothetical protein
MAYLVSQPLPGSLDLEADTGIHTGWHTSHGPRVGPRICCVYLPRMRVGMPSVRAAAQRAVHEYGSVPTTDQKVRGSNPFGRTSAEQPERRYSDRITRSLSNGLSNSARLPPRSWPQKTRSRRSDRHPPARPPVPGAGLRGHRPATGKQLILTGSAATELEAIAIRDRFRKQSTTEPRSARISPSRSCSPSGSPVTRSSRAPAPATPC